MICWYKYLTPINWDDLVTSNGCDYRKCNKFVEKVNAYIKQQNDGRVCIN